MLLAALVLLPLVSTTGWPSEPEITPWQAPTSAEQEVIRRPDRVEAFRVLHGVFPVVDAVEQAPDKRSGFAVDSFSELSEDQCQAVSRILLDDLPSMPAVSKMPSNPFFPTVGMTFHRDGRTVDALFDMPRQTAHVGSGTGPTDPVAGRLRVIFQQVSLMQEVGAMSADEALFRHVRSPNSEELEIIRAADRVQTFGVHPMEAANYQLGGRKKDFEDFGLIGRFFITKVGPDLSRDQQANVTALLLDDRSYMLHRHGGKKCVFTPRHALRFHRGDQVVESLICFTCNELQIGSGRGDFDPSAAALGEIFREVGLAP